MHFNSKSFADCTSHTDKPKCTFSKGNWGSWVKMEILGRWKWKICHSDVKLDKKWVYLTKMFTGYSSIKWVHKPHQLLLWKSCMTLQGLNFDKFISRVIYFNVAKLKLHLSSKWSKIKGQKTFNSFFEYKELESSGHLWWIFNRMDI